jgi:hypothetical protein
VLPCAVFHHHHPASSHSHSSKHLCSIGVVAESRQSPGCGAAQSGHSPWPYHLHDTGLQDCVHTSSAGPLRPCGRHAVVQSAAAGACLLRCQHPQTRLPNAPKRTTMFALLCNHTTTVSLCTKQNCTPLPLATSPAHSAATPSQHLSCSLMNTCAFPPLSCRVATIVMVGHGFKAQQFNLCIGTATYRVLALDDAA